MKLNNTLALIFAGLGLVAACEDSNTLSEAEQNATYTAAVNQGETADTEGVPDDSAVPGEDDATATDEDRGVHRDCSMNAVHERLLAEADTNGDGELSEEERAAMERPFGEHGPRGPCVEQSAAASSEEGSRPPRAMCRGGGHARGPHGPASFRRLLWIYDADASGELDDAERAILEADLEARAAALEAATLAAFDADGDGTLSDAELEAAREAHRAEREARRAAELATYDADGDGRLNREERQAMHEAKRAALEAQFDADGSGALDETETAALREHLRSIVRGEASTEV